MRTFLIFAATLLLSIAQSTAQETIKLSTPNLKRGTSAMEAISKRQSTREFSDKQISTADLSDLFWAAYGINREDGKRTAPSAFNAQDISLYGFMESGVYLYNPEKHQLDLVVAGDHRKLAAGQQEFAQNAPLVIVYVSDLKKLERTGERNMIIASMDAAVISQNVSIFCAAVDMATVTRGSMDSEGISKLLNFDATKAPIMNNVVGYKK